MGPRVVWSFGRVLLVVLLLRVVLALALLDAVEPSHQTRVNKPLDAVYTQNQVFIAVGATVHLAVLFVTHTVALRLEVREAGEPLLIQPLVRLVSPVALRRVGHRPVLFLLKLLLVALTVSGVEASRTTLVAFLLRQLLLAFVLWPYVPPPLLGLVRLTFMLLLVVSPLLRLQLLQRAQLRAPARTPVSIRKVLTLVKTQICSTVGRRNYARTVFSAITGPTNWSSSTVGATRYAGGTLSCY